MIHFQSVIPVSLFKKDTKEYLIRLEATSGPIMLTVHGRGVFVLEHLNSYMRLAELADLAIHQRALDSVLDRVRAGEE